jgi:hypothetical protein
VGRRFALLLACGLAPLAAISAISCGARTGLPLDVFADAARDVVAEETRGEEPPPDAADVRDSSIPDEAAPDMFVPDVLVDECPDAASTLIYVATELGELWSFDPNDSAFARIGALACPAAADTSPFSMAVNRHGIAYVVYNSGQLFRVSTATAACAKTSFPTQPMPFHDFGMGFVANVPLSNDGGVEAEAGPDGGAGQVDRLFVASGEQIVPSALGYIDTSTYALDVVGPLRPGFLYGVELTGTGDGRLYAYFGNSNDTMNGIAQIDPRTAQVLTSWTVPVPHGFDWAFAFWGGAFFLFTSQDGVTTDVHRFDPAASALSLVTKAPAGVVVVGAGVSTCAPL